MHFEFHRYEQFQANSSKVNHSPKTEALTAPKWPFHQQARRNKYNYLIDPVKADPNNPFVFYSNVVLFLSICSTPAL